MLKSKISRKVLAVVMIVIMMLANFGELSGVRIVYATEVWNEITNRTDLENIKNNLSGNYRLMADIDLAGQDWVPLGSDGSPFTGKLDGNSRVIRNLTITDTTNMNKGLFSAIGSGGEIRRLGIEGVNITAANNTGILAGTNAGIISQCYTKGSISGFDYVGGLVGQNSGTIQNSYTQANVSGKDYLGGLAGLNSGTVENSYASSALTPSVFNYYLEFNGTPVGDYSAPNTGGYIDIPHKDVYVGNKFTLEAWFQWDKVGTNDCNFIIGKGYEQFEIHTGGGSGVNGIRFIPIWNNNGDSWIDVKNVIQPGWFHVAAVYDYSDSLKQASARVFINGVAQDLWRGTTNLGKIATLYRDTNTLGYGKVNNVLIPQQNNINIGRRTDGWYYFDGKICDVRFWNVARTEEEIKRDKDKVLTGTETGLVGYWKLNEASGAALDSTANHNNGTLTGAVSRTSGTAAVHKGGLIGYNTGTVTNSFYDSEVANLADVAAGAPKTNAEMKNKDTYTGAGWDFTNVWDITTSYPILREQTYTVTFESNGGSATASIPGKRYQETITTPPELTKTGNTFGGWYKEPSLNSQWNFTSDTMPAKDITLYAKWTVNTYTVTFKDYNDTTLKTETVNHGGSATAPANLSRNGYTFTGWSPAYVNVTDDLTVIAQYTINQYTVTFKDHDNTTLKTETVNHGGSATAPANPTRNGYTFTGWSTTYTNITGDLTVMAQYTINQYTVTFKDHDNTTLKTETVNYGGNATAPTNPSRNGYTFTGWSTTYTNITGDLTVTAQYTANSGIAYKVEHYQQTVDGTGYTLYETENLTGTTDESVTASAKSYTGFSENISHAGRVATGSVAADGSLVLKLYYDRVYSYSIAPIDDQIMTAITEGYAEGMQEIKTITIMKTGTGKLENLTVTVSGAVYSNFEVTQPVEAILNAETTSTTLTVKAKNGLSAGIYTETITVSADNMTSVAFTVTQEVKVLSTPTILSTVPGDGHVTVTWSSLPEATGYKIYKSTVSGSYGTEAVSVSGDVYSCNVAGLTNGTTYYFVVLAANGGVTSVHSNEVSAIPQVAAPGAPVLESAIAGDGHVNIAWNAVAGSIGYKVYVGTISGFYNISAPTVSSSVYGSVYSYSVSDLINGTTYYFVIKAVNPGGDSAYSNEISAVPQVLAPAAPLGVTAVEGNAKVMIHWNSVTGAADYKIYRSTISGLYGSEFATVAGSVYSYDATGLTNGVTYYFIIKASNAGGYSINSVEVSATPKTVPGAPANVTAVAGNGQAIITFTAPLENGGSPIIRYIVTSDPDNITATGTGTPVTITGLANGTVYKFTVKAVNEVGSGPESAASNEVRPYNPSDEGGNTETNSTESTKTSESGVEILVNGKTETAAKATTAIVEDKTITTIIVDDKIVTEKLEKERHGSVVTIPVKNDSDIVVGMLNGQTVKNMEVKEAVLEVKTENIIYTLPASQINIDAVSEHIGKQVELKDITVNVKISGTTIDTAKIVEETANKNNYQVVVKPVEFEITCNNGDKTIEVSKFNAYVERMVAIPEGVDPSRITTGVVLNNDGTFSHVPTAITVIDGKYYAKINSLTNSTYSVICSPKTFTDVETHWAKEAVNDMGSRLVIDGVGDNKFEPDRGITRAEFAAIVVKALGLMRPDTGKDAFSDVTKASWYYDAVSIAYEYGIISGCGNGKFEPVKKITREQAMTMIARAMKLTRLKADLKIIEIESLLAGFGDSSQSADWAMESMAACVKVGIVSGKSEKIIAPKDEITRAEVAVIVKRLLQKSGLI